jgi:hypothetical protein
MKWAVPGKLQIEKDPLKLRLDFHNESVVLYEFCQDESSVRMVSAVDVARALAKGLSFGTGLLPANTLWWNNTRGGPVFALWEPERIRKVALQLSFDKEPKRFTIPLPGLIFLCSPGKPPSIYAAKKKPTKASDVIFHAPLCNIFQDGKSCPGNHIYPSRVQDIIESFFMAFFSATAHLEGRSKKYKSVVKLWESLDGKKEYPLNDLVKFGTVADIMEAEC